LTLEARSLENLVYFFREELRAISRGDKKARNRIPRGARRNFIKYGILTKAIWGVGAYTRLTEKGLAILRARYYCSFSKSK
jgi:hypothetical protein